jgi:hypothetical protein
MLGLFDMGKGFKVGFHNDDTHLDKHGPVLSKTMLDICEKRSSIKIMYFTKPFKEAVEAASSKLFCGNVWSDVKECNYLILDREYSTFVSFDVVGNTPSGRIVIYFCNIFIVHLRFHILGVHPEGIGIKLGHSDMFHTNQINSNAAIEVADGLSSNDAIDMLIKEALAEVLFIQFAEVVTKTIFPKSKRFNIRCDYRNDTKREILVMDSPYFTNIVKSEGFKVSGHWRIQPFKEGGIWSKKIIWISDFHKNGYTRNAGITKI